VASVTAEGTDLHIVANGIDRVIPAEDIIAIERKPPHVKLLPDGTVNPDWLTTVIRDIDGESLEVTELSIERITREWQKAMPKP